MLFLIDQNTVFQLFFPIFGRYWSQHIAFEQKHKLKPFLRSLH